jgi:pimeloyl-ACP methyl ester carboxylesterase
MSHLHRMMKGEFRSVLIDRPGTGWSGIASFPRTTAAEADEMWQVLAAAGERGPFVLVGHSFGGLLAVNMARRAPNRVAALVLLDATPPDVIVYGPNLGAAQLSWQAFQAGVAQLFGIDLETLGSGPRPVGPLEKIIAAQLGRQGEILKAQSKLPRAQMAGASIYSELSAAGMAKDAWNMTVYDGELDDMPVYLVAPDTLPPAASLPKTSAREQERLLNLLKRGRERYMAVSDRSQRIIAPPGTGHNFIYEAPQTVIDAVHQAAGQQPVPASP